MQRFGQPGTISEAGLFTFTSIANCAKMLIQPFVSRAAGKASRRQKYPVRSGPLRVAVVTQHFPTSQQQWAGHTAYQTLRILAKRCDVHVFYPEATYPSFLTPRGGRSATLDRDWSPPGVDTTYIAYPALPVLSRPLNGLGIAAQLLPHIRSYDPDVILNYTVYPDGFAAVRIANELGIPAVITAVGSDLNRIPDALCRMLTRATLRRANFVSTVSHNLYKKAQTLDADPARSAVNLNGCDTSAFYSRDRRKVRRALGIDPDGQVIVYVGRLDYRKGLIELIDAVGKLLAERPSLRCYIVGDGPDRPALVEAIDRNNAAASIILIPSCPTDKVALWMSASDLVTLPSYAEGCPNAIVEALSSGRPVVATNVGGIPELVNDTCGRLVPSKDVPALAAALDTVLSETWDADAIVARQSRSWSEVADQVYRTLRAILGWRQEVEVDEERAAA